MCNYILVNEKACITNFLLQVHKEALMILDQTLPTQYPAPANVGISHASPNRFFLEIWSGELSLYTRCWWFLFGILTSFKTVASFMHKHVQVYVNSSRVQDKWCNNSFILWSLSKQSLPINSYYVYNLAILCIKPLLMVCRSSQVRSYVIRTITVIHYVA